MPSITVMFRGGRRSDGTVVMASVLRDRVR